MTDFYTLAVIVGLALVTVLTRGLFLISSKPWTLPPWALRALQYAPIAALAAVVAPEVIWLSVLNATLCTAVPVLMVMMAIERIGAGLAAQTGMVGPMSTILMGVLVLGEPFTGWVAAGTVLVVAGIFVFTSSPRRT